jgi:hypothetical protein
LSLKIVGGWSYQSANPPPATLKDVKIDGDRATAKLVCESEGKEQTESATFEKVGNAWKVDLLALGKSKDKK